MLATKLRGVGTTPPPPVSSVVFHGEVTVASLINGTDLASWAGVTQGTAQFSTEPWLHFTLDGKQLYVAKKPLRHSISWDHLNDRNLVYGRPLYHRGINYQVRLLKGCNVDPSAASIGYNPTGTDQSEWDRLLYSVHNGVHTNTSNTTPPGATPLYSDADLHVHANFGNGTYGWCQETPASNSARRILRGYYGVSFLDNTPTSTAIAPVGWRPVLELVV